MRFLPWRKRSKQLTQLAATVRAVADAESMLHYTKRQTERLRSISEKTIEARQANHLSELFHTLLVGRPADGQGNC